VQFDCRPNIPFIIMTNTTVRSPEQLEDSHKLVLKMAPASVSGVGCGFLKEVNRPSPEADLHINPGSRLRMCVRGAVPKLLNTSSYSGV
jgi:hypothetical protein